MTVSVGGQQLPGMDPNQTKQECILMQTKLKASAWVLIQSKKMWGGGATQCTKFTLGLLINRLTVANTNIHLILGDEVSHPHPRRDTVQSCTVTQ